MEVGRQVSRHTRGDRNTRGSGVNDRVLAPTTGKFSLNYFFPFFLLAFNNDHPGHLPPPKQCFVCTKVISNYIFICHSLEE